MVGKFALICALEIQKIQMVVHIFSYFSLFTELMWVYRRVESLCKLKKENIPLRLAHKSYRLRQALSYTSTERKCPRDKCPISNTGFSVFTKKCSVPAHV